MHDCGHKVPLTEAEETLDHAEETILRTHDENIARSVAVDGPHLAGTTTAETFSKATFVTALLLSLVTVAGGRAHHVWGGCG